MLIDVLLTKYERECQHGKLKSIGLVSVSVKPKFDSSSYGNASYGQARCELLSEPIHNYHKIHSANKDFFDLKSLYAIGIFDRVVKLLKNHYNHSKRKSINVDESKGSTIEDFLNGKN